MAKLGEGDARWIVNDMGDSGKNVNNWHWREYDCLQWSEAQLKNSLIGLDLAAQDGLSMKVVDVSVTGEAIVNNRKNKLIPAYELEISIKWEGTGSTTGRVLLPYVSDENHDETPEVRWSSETDDETSTKLREAFHAGGKKAVVERVGAFVEALRAGGPMAPGSKGAAEAHAAANAAAAESNGSAKAKLSSANPDEVKKAIKANTASSGKTLELTEKYYARASDIYECFIVEGKVCAYTQSKAIVEPRPGGKFSWFNGSVHGEFVELEADRKLVMKWKFSTWADDCFSTVTLTFDTPEHGTTIVSLKQTGIPHEDRFGQAVIEQTETGWRQQIFSRIRQVFGYGC